MVWRVSLIVLLPERKETGVKVVDGKTNGEKVVLGRNASGTTRGETAVRKWEETKKGEGPGENAKLEDTAAERGP